MILPVLLVLILIYLWYWNKYMCSKPRIFCQETESNKEILTRLSGQLNEKYRPTPWCAYSHAMTIINITIRFRASPDVVYDRQLVKLRDGGQVSLDWALTERVGDPKRNAVTVAFMTGLTGSSMQPELKLMCRSLLDNGMNVVVIHFRGMGNTLLTTDYFGFCCQEDVDDVDHIIFTQLETWGNRQRLFSLGISMGGNVVTHCGKDPATIYDGIMSVGNFFRPSEIVADLSWFYMFFFNAKRKALLRKNSHVFATKKYSRLLSSSSMSGFDSIMNEHAYDDIQKFYEENRSDDKVGICHVPILLLASLDDPFVPARCIPYKEALANPNAILAVTDHGGHCGFLDGWLGLNGPSWMERLVVKYFNALLSEYQGDPVARRHKTKKE